MNNDEKLIEEVTGKLFNFALTEEKSGEDHAKEIIQLVRDSEWVSVEDELPEESPYSILVGRSGKAGIPCTMEAKYIGGSFLVDGMQQSFKTPTHWQLLPSPPQPKEQ